MKDVRSKTGKRTRGTAPRLLYDSLLKKIPGFLYIAEISKTEFKPITCIGGFTSLTGFPTRDFLRVGSYNSKMVAHNDLESLQTFRNSVTDKLKPAGINYHLTTRSGKNLIVNEQIVILRGNGEPKLVGGIVTAVGQLDDPVAPSRIKEDKVRLQEIQRINKHLIEVNQLKDEFLANTSHELRTPLNSIIGFLTLITEDYYDSEEELRLFTRNALDSSYHLLSVINDLLDISKIEAGKMQVQIEKIYVDELIKDIYSLFKVQADQKGLSLECSTRGSPLFAAADITKLKQALINLTGNAIKFTLRGIVKVTAESQDGHILFVVKDTGIGIPREKLDKLFQKFIQVDGSATRRFSGTGLGLAISKHLVEMMGGKIEIDSEGLGSGTSVHFTIPGWTEEEE